MSAYAVFQRDFAPLELALRREARRRCMVMTPERMIVELGLTPRKAARIEKINRIELNWFKPVYTAMRRHRLVPRGKMEWETWLRLYRQRQGELTSAPRRKARG